MTVAIKKRPNRAAGRILKDIVKVMSMGPDMEILRFTFSEDIIEKLVSLHDETWGVEYLVRSQKLGLGNRKLRLDISRLVDMSMPAVHVRIEAPTFDPKGVRLWRATGGRRWHAQIHADRCGVSPAIMTKRLETLWLDRDRVSHGLIVIFPDGDVVWPGVKGDVRAALKSQTEQEPVR